MKDGWIPQMMPMMWMVFPIVVVVIGLVVMMINEIDKLEVGSEVLMSLGMESLKW